MIVFHFSDAVRRNRKFADVADDAVRLKCASFFTSSRDRRKEDKSSEALPDESDRHSLSSNDCVGSNDDNDDE